MRFSQRQGLSPQGKPLQRNDVDPELRSGLWNAMYIYFWEEVTFAEGREGRLRASSLYPLFFQYWMHYFKKPVDAIPDDLTEALGLVKEYFFSCPWYEVYDFIEFSISVSGSHQRAPFQNFCNNVLLNENSAYRLRDSRFVDVAQANPAPEAAKLAAAD